MIDEEIIKHEISTLSLQSIIDKYHLTPIFDTWVSIKGNTLGEIKYSAYADCGIRLYMDHSDVCVGLIQHDPRQILGVIRIPEWVTDSFGKNTLGTMPWQMGVCADAADFGNKLEKLFEAYRNQQIQDGRYKLFKVELSGGGYDSYDSAIIACVDKATLEELCKTKFNQYRTYDDSQIRFEQHFDIHGDQKVMSIEEIGVYSGIMYRDELAKVICSSYNAG